MTGEKRSLLGNNHEVDVTRIDNDSAGGDYRAFNSMINLLNAGGGLQLEQDQVALSVYFKKEINPKYRKFETLGDKLNYLFENEYYERRHFDNYDFNFIKSLYKKAYSYNFRFGTFMAALKFYSMYGLKTFDGNEYLESFEDRVVANAVFLGGGDEKLALQIVEEMITRRYQPATPTFSNAGKAQRGSYTSCYLLNVDDNIESINRSITDSMHLSKRGGGVALNISNLRESGAPIKKVTGQSSGVVPVMKLYEDAFKYANQQGVRQGAGAAYLSVHHPDILQFLDTKKENADEAIRIKTLSIGVIIPDVTYHLSKNNQADTTPENKGNTMALFSPYDIKKVYGLDFNEVDITEMYDELVANDAIKKTWINPRNLFGQIAKMQFESGYPYIMNVDSANRAHNNAGKITMSNLCVTGDTEILTSKGYRKVVDLYDSQEDLDVIVDERARTFDFANVGTSVQTSTKMFKTAEGAEVLKLETLEGFELKATPWHKMYVERDGEVVKIPLAEVEIGDKILVQGAESAQFGDIDKVDEAYLAGIIAADGTFAKQRNGLDETVRIDLYGDKREFKEDVTKSVHRVLKNREDLLKNHSATSTPSFNESTFVDKVFMTSAPLARALGELGFNKETKHTVPEFVKQGNAETVKAYISGLFQLDGTITGVEKLGSITIELGSTEKSLLADVQKLLLTFGVFSRIYDSKKGGFAPLPDGRGGLKEYEQKKSYSLRISDRQSRDTMYTLVNWLTKHKEYWEKRNASLTNKVYQTHKFRGTVKSIEFYGHEDVYDVTVENGHSLIFNGIATGNCSEILQASNPSTFNADNSFKEVGRDISCNLGSLNVDNTFNSQNFSLTVETAMRALTTVTNELDEDIECSPSVQKGNRDNHAVGLGQMNLHGFLARNFIEYDSEEAVDFTRMYFYSTLYQVLRASNKIAMETGKTYWNFKDSKYASGEFFDKYTENELPDFETDKVRGLFASSTVHVPTRQDWLELKDSVAKHGLYHAYMQAIAPTGSISYVNEATSSIHPIVAPIEARKDGMSGRVFVPMPHLNDDTVGYYRTAYMIDNKAIIDIYAAAQEFVDQGMSLTLFYSNENTTRDLIRTYIYAWTKGIKTLYYARIQTKSLDGTEVEDANALCESCMV